MNKYKIKNYYNYFKSWRRIMRRYNCAFSSQFSLPPDWYYLISGAALLCTRLLKRLDPTGMAVQVAIIQICRANWSKKNEEKLRLKVWHVHLDVNRRARVPSWTRKKSPANETALDKTEIGPSQDSPRGRIDLVCEVQTVRLWFDYTHVYLMSPCYLYILYIYDKRCGIVRL
jgi:hypothetical protein